MVGHDNLMSVRRRGHPAIMIAAPTSLHSLRAPTGLIGPSPRRKGGLSPLLSRTFLCESSGISVGRPDASTLGWLSRAIEYQRRLRDDVRRQRGCHRAVLLEGQLDGPLSVLSFDGGPVDTKLDFESLHATRRFIA